MGLNQAQPTLWPAGFLSYPGKAAAWGPSPGTRRLASGAPARRLFLPQGPADREAGAHRPSGFGSHPAGQAWGWIWLPGTPWEVNSFPLLAAEVHALTLWTQSFISCPHRRREGPL